MVTAKSMIDDNIILSDFEVIKNNIETLDAYDGQDEILYSVKFDVAFAFKIKENLVRTNLRCLMSGTDDITKKEIINAEFNVVYIYSFKDLSKEMTTDSKGNNALKDKTSLRLNNISLATTRGLLLSFVQNTPLKKFFLPILKTEN